MTFAQVIELLRDGRPRKFTHPNLGGFFYKAKFPSRERDIRIDGALSAITWHGTSRTARLVMLLDDFDRDDWTVEECYVHPETSLRAVR